MVYNDIEVGRDRLSLAMSEDEGQTWKHHRRLERNPKGLFHYPSIIETKDGLLQLTYTFQPEEAGYRSIKHVTLAPDWIQWKP